jgi:superfamily II DNA or RNA helicase
MSVELKLRPYQEEALRVSKEKWEQGITRQLLALPTGTGKTCIFASLLQHHRFLGKMLVLVHRDELARQAEEKIREWNPQLPKNRLGTEMGSKRCTGLEKVVVAGVQSLGHTDSPRLQKLRPSSFDVIVCDEAHHSTADTYRNVFDHFGLFNDGNKKLLLGVTATPFRADDKTLIPNLYQDIIYNTTMLDAIEQGWLCDVRSYRIRTAANLDPIITRGKADDFPEGQLDKAINNRVRNALVARDWKKLAVGRRIPGSPLFDPPRTIVFAVTINHARELAAAFREQGVEAEAIWGDDPKRREKLQAHQQGRFKVLCNCGVLTEGYDDWQIECIVMARPTLSRVLFVQMIGRGTRIEDRLPNLVEARQNGDYILKTECIVIDVVDNTKKHDLVTLASLFNRNLNFHGKSLSEIHKHAKIGEVPNPYLSPTEAQEADRTRTHIEEADLFKGMRAPSGSFSLDVEPPGSGYINGLESSPGLWRLKGTIDGVPFDSGAALTENEARVTARELAWRRTDAPTVTDLLRRRSDKRPCPRKYRGAVVFNPCPFCGDRMRTDKWYMHIVANCNKRPGLKQDRGAAQSRQNQGAAHRLTSFRDLLGPSNPD